MEDRFNIGDKVYLFDARNCYTAELNKSYIVIDMIYNACNGVTKIALQYDGVNLDTDYECYLDSRRFKKDIKFSRKLKLKEIYKND